MLVALASTEGLAQIAHQPGKIIRRATGSGDAILNPDTNDWITVSDGVFTTNGDDTSSSVSEIHYRAIMPYGGEPCCDLRRGPDHRFSDFVPDNNNNGVYLNFTNSGVDATSYLRIRMRMGTIIPGSKGFSLLIDTDSAFGAAGTRPDGNYVAKTTGINGNPGFEIEVVLETGFRVAIYNVDGKGNPSDGIDTKSSGTDPHLIFTDNSWEARSQVSFAATTEGGDPDYFIDWYVSLEELKKMKPTSLGTSYIQSAFQRLRIIPTTVMAPKPSIAGPISDVYGSDDSITMANQPKICLPCEEVSGLCTAAPVVTSAVASGGSNNVQGTWSKATYGGSIATIYIYKGTDTSSVLATVTNVSSGGTWQATVAGLAGGDVVFAKAKGNSTYESRWCFNSNSVVVGTCTSRPPPLSTVTIATGKGISGTGYADNTNGAGTGSDNGSNSGVYKIQVYKVGSSGMSMLGVDEFPKSYANRLNPANVATHYNLGQTTGTWQYSGGSGGPSDLTVTAGQYAFYTQTSAGCKSAPVFSCHAASGNTDNPTLTTDGGEIYTTSTTVGGAITAVAHYPSVVRVYVDSVYQGDATLANAGLSNVTWSYTFATSLTAGKKVWIRTQKAEAGGSYYCEGSLEKTIITACTNKIPIFNVDSTTNKIAEGVVLSGTATAGGTLIIKNSTHTTVATTTVGTDGTWSALNSGTSFGDGFTGNARLADVSYYATLTTSGCATAATSLSWIVAGKTTESYCSGTLQFSIDAGTGGTYNTVVSGGTLTGTKLTSDAKWIKGALGGTPSANTKTIRIYVNDGLVGRETVPAFSNNWPDIYVGGYLAQNDVLTIAVTENDGVSAEMVCASIQIICDCATSNKPAVPSVNVAASTLTVAPGASATIKLQDPQDNNFISVKNKYTGRSLSRGVYYTGGTYTVTGRFFGAGETLTFETTPLDSSQTATIVTSRIGGTETCIESTEQPLVVNSALPVNLTDFKGYKSQKSIVLSWTTATEIDFSHFEIERSADGISYQTIGKKQGTGMLSGPNYYSYTDQSPLQGNNFYRLKMVDLDGRFEMSKVILLKNNGAGIMVNALRPNPFVNEVNISAVLKERSEISVVLTDAAGRTLRNYSQAGVAGLNELSLRNLGMLPAGTYYINVVAGKEILRYKLLKLNQ